MRALLSAIIFGSATIFPAHGGERDDKVNGERQALEDSELWIYNDLDKGFARAKASGRPMLVGEPGYVLPVKILRGGREVELKIKLP